MGRKADKRSGTALESRKWSETGRHGHHLQSLDSLAHGWRSLLLTFLSKRTAEEWKHQVGKDQVVPRSVRAQPSYFMGGLPQWNNS